MPGEDVKGLNALGKLLDRLPEELQRKVIQSGLRKAANEMVAPLQAAAPVFTGKLEQSIEVKAEGAGSRVARQRASLSDKLLVSAGIRLRSPGRYYWHFTEFGTSKMPARPWIRPTFERIHPTALKTFKGYIGKRIEREAKKLARANRG